MHTSTVFPREGNGTPLQYSCLENPMDRGAWWAAVHGVARSRTLLNDLTSTFPFHAREKEMATHSSVLAWRIPGTGEPRGLPSLGSYRVGHDWSDLAAATVFPGASQGGASGKEPSCQCRRCYRHGFNPHVRKIPWKRAWQPNPVFLPRGILWTEKPDRLQSIASLRVGHDWRDLAHRHCILVGKSSSHWDVGKQFWHTSACMLSHLSHVRLFATPWTVVHQATDSVHGILQARILEWAAIYTRNEYYYWMIIK